MQSSRSENFSDFNIDEISLKNSSELKTLLETEINPETKNKIREELSKRVTIYIWKGESSSLVSIAKRRMGHAALETHTGGEQGQGVYVSLWPDANCANKISDCNKKCSHFHSRSQDVRFLNKQPEEIFLYGLNIEAINKLFLLANRTNEKGELIELEWHWIDRLRYRTFIGFSLTKKTTSCSGLVYHFLEKAGINKISQERVHSALFQWIVFSGAFLFFFSSLYYSYAIAKKGGNAILQYTHLNYSVKYGPIKNKNFTFKKGIITGIQNSLRGISDSLAGKQYQNHLSYNANEKIDVLRLKFQIAILQMESKKIDIESTMRNKKLLEFRLKNTNELVELIIPILQDRKRIQDAEIEYVLIKEAQINQKFNNLKIQVEKECPKNIWEENELNRSLSELSDQCRVLLLHKNKLETEMEELKPRGLHIEESIMGFEKQLSDLLSERDDIVSKINNLPQNTDLIKKLNKLNLKKEQLIHNLKNISSDNTVLSPNLNQSLFYLGIGTGEILATLIWLGIGVGFFAASKMLFPSLPVENPSKNFELSIGASVLSHIGSPLFAYLFLSLGGLLGSTLFSWQYSRNLYNSLRPNDLYDLLKKIKNPSASSMSMFGLFSKKNNYPENAAKNLTFTQPGFN